MMASRGVARRRELREGQGDPACCQRRQGGLAAPRTWAHARSTLWHGAGGRRRRRRLRPAPPASESSSGLHLARAHWPTNGPESNVPGPSECRGLPGRISPGDSHASAFCSPVGSLVGNYGKTFSALLPKTKRNYRYAWRAVAGDALNFASFRASADTMPQYGH